MSAAVATSFVDAFFRDWGSVDSRYIRPELYTLRKPLNALLLSLAALAAYPQIIGQDKINCMPHEYCTITNNDSTKCSTREDRYTISDLSYNQKLYIDDDCRKTHMTPYRFYLLYILLGASVVSIIIQRLWRVLPQNNVFVLEFLRIVHAAERDAGIERLLNKIHAPRKDVPQTESQVEENIQVIEHLLHYDDDLQQGQKQGTINLVDRAQNLKSGHSSTSVSLNIMSVVSTLLHVVLSVAFILASIILQGFYFPQEFICLHPSFDVLSNRMLCVDLQAIFLTVVRLAFFVLLLVLSVTRLLMEIRIQFLVHFKYKGNVQKILRYKVVDGKGKTRKHRNLLLLLTCLKLYDKKLFNGVSLLLSEQMNEVRRRQKKSQLVRHLQSVVSGGRLGCVRHFLRHLRRMHVPDSDGSLQDVIAEAGEVEINLSGSQLSEFRACVNAVILADDGQQMTALHRGVDSGQPEVVEHLLLAGADPNVRDVRRETPLHRAMRNGQSNMVDVLLRKKADIGARNKDGQSPIDLAPDKHLLWDMLCLAVRAGTDLELIKTLIDAGVDLHTSRTDVGSLLHVAVHKNSSKITKLLIDSGAKLEQKNSNNRTPLQVAVVGASVKVVKILAEAGADLTVTVTERGKSLGLMELAQQNDRSAVKEYLAEVFRERGLAIPGAPPAELADSEDEDEDEDDMKPAFLTRGSWKDTESRDAWRRQADSDEELGRAGLFD